MTSDGLSALTTPANAANAVARAILHVDMDAFYAAIEQRDRSDLRGQPVIVGGLSARGVVATASYEARAFGVHSAMPMREARLRCPQGKFVAPRMQVYRQVSAEIFNILHCYTPLVEGLSLDEAFLDVTASQAAFGEATRIARDIKIQIHAQTRLTASVGIAPNKLVAKIASDLKKPDGLVIVTSAQITELLDPLPIRKLFGIGPKTAAQLNQIDIHTLRDLRSCNLNQLQAVVGRDAQMLQRRASGIDARPVLSECDEKQISTETTFDVDIANRSLLRSELLRLADKTAARLRAKRLAAYGIAVKIRRHDFTTYTRQRRCSPTDGSNNIIDIAQELLNEWLNEQPTAAVRLLGVGVYDLGSVVQLSLFDAPAASVPTSSLDGTIDAIRAKFGSSLLTRASALPTTPGYR